MTAKAGCSLSPIQALVQLETIDIESTESFDLAALGQMKSLHSVSLGSVAVTDLSPLRWLPLLKTLWLSDLDLQSLVPVVDVSTHLDVLGLKKMAIADFLPLTQLAGLHGLHLVQVGFKDLGILVQFPVLEDLSLGGNNLVEVGLLGQLKTLRSLSLADNDLASLAAIRPLAQLESLDVSDNPITDLEPIAGLWELRRLDLSGTKVTDIAVLLNYTKLEWVDLRDTPVTFGAGSAAQVVVDRLRARGAEVKL